MDLWIHVSLIVALSRLLLEQSLSASFWVSIHSSIGVNWRNCTYEIVSLSQYCTIHQSLVKFKRKFTYFGTTLYKVRKLCLQILGCFQVSVIWFFFYKKSSVNNLWNTFKSISQAVTWTFFLYKKNQMIATWKHHKICKHSFLTLYRVVPK